MSIIRFPSSAGVPKLLSPSFKISSRQRLFGLATAGVVAWVALQALHYNRLIFHDAWQYVFPDSFHIGRASQCGALPQWLFGIDNGSPVFLEIISSSLMFVARLPALYLNGCLQLDVRNGIYFQKIEIFAAYLGFAAGMYVLGRLLYRERASAIFLFLLTLFSGFSLNSLHSDQHISTVFWLPWIATAGTFVHRQLKRPEAVWYACLAVLFFSMQALDLYFHLTLLPIVVALLIYVALFPEAAGDAFRRHFAGPQVLRFWPAITILAILAAQLLIIRVALNDYVSSFRPDIVVNLAQNDETGWIQPTALLATIFPLSFLAAYDALAGNFGQWLGMHGVGQRMFDFRLDILMLNFGAMTVALVIVFLVHPDNRRLRLGWGLFALAIFLVSLQQSGLSYLLFYLPFFDVLRSYGLFFSVVVFAVLAMAGYGMDVLLTLSPAARRTTFLRTAVVLAGLVGIAAAAIIWMASLEPNSTTAWQLIRAWAPDDSALLLAAIAAIGALAFSKAPLTKISLVGLILIASQVVHLDGIYRLTSISVDDGIKKFGLTPQDYTPLPDDQRSDPNAYRRGVCTVFAQCYLSLRDMASLRTDHQAPFLRNRRLPVLQRGLSMRVIEALSGVDHPVFWTSRRLAGYASDAELIKTLDAHEQDIDAWLSEMTFVPQSTLSALPSVQAASLSTATLSDLSWQRDGIKLHYRATTPVVLCMAITYDPNWRIQINGKAAHLVPANFGGSATVLPTGDGEVALHYANPWSEFIFVSRQIMLGLAILAALYLVRRANRLPDARRATRAAESVLMKGFPGWRHVGDKQV